MPLDYLGISWSPDEPTKQLENWNFQSHPLTSRWQQFNQSCLCNEASIKTQKNRVWRASGWWTREDWVVCCPWRGHGSLAPLSHTLACAFLPSSCCWLYPFMINQWSSKQNISLSSMSPASKLIEPEEGCCWTLQFITSWLEAKVTTWAYNWGLKWGQSCETESLTCGLRKTFSWPQSKPGIR